MLSGYDRSIDAVVWRAVKLVIVNAQAIADALQRQHDMPWALARTVYNGLPDAAYHSRDRTVWTIGFVARLDKAKGVMVLLDAFRELSARWPKVRLKLVGQGDASSVLATRIRELGLETRVEASGYSEGNIHRTLESFRIYAFPSFHEGLPYSILEAMRAGCTIVASSVGGIPEILRDGCEGVLVPPRDTAALAKAIDRLLTNEEEAFRMGRAARERFERNYRLENFHSNALRAFADAGLLEQRHS
jgi:glycosyltransferase involved in cell wall biosynthesis